LYTLDFDDELKNLIISNGIVQFYAFGNYFYIRNFSDYGIIGQIENDRIAPILILPQLRIANNSMNTIDNYYIFFIRGSNQYYMLCNEEGSILKGTIQLRENESIRHAISDGENLCVNVLDGENTETFVTKYTQIYSYRELLKQSAPFVGFTGRMSMYSLN
jgi:hypothetical protein